MLAQVGITPALLQPDLDRFAPPAADPPPASTRPLTPEAEQMLYIAQREASFWESEKVETMHLLLALLRDENSPISRLFDRHGVQYQFLFDMAAYDRVGLSGMQLR
jgi:ATP-dependent Clp protease ATP-binding subunit ClpC